MVIGKSAHALAWQASRDDKLRPVVVSQWGQLGEVLSEVPTNLIILSVKHWTAPAASNLIRAFYQHTIKN